jgi:hypothetical protein
LRRLPLYLLLLCFTALLAGCDILKMSLLSNREARGSSQDLAALPSKFSQRVSQFVFVSDFEIKVEQAPFRELTSLRENILRELRLPPPPPSALINVYLFEDRERYEQFMRAHYPKLPRRRAFFVAQPRGVGSGDDLLVYTFWGEHVRQDLRHELTHALLHGILKDVPLWLDEGLAEYFEIPLEARGVNPQHVQIIQRDGFKPDMARLEQLNEVEQMTPAEYREAWAWVHFMLRGNPDARKVLLAYLQQLRTTSSPGPLQPKLKAKVPDVNEALLGYLGRL